MTLTLQIGDFRFQISDCSQLLRSGSEVASNYRSACRARPRAEFVARIGVALDEADESALWFEILTESGISRVRDLQVATGVR